MRCVLGLTFQCLIPKLRQGMRKFSGQCGGTGFSKLLPLPQII